MPRAGRRCPGGLVYHVLNRGNDRKPIFHKQGDARAFITLLVEAKKRLPGVRLLAWCLMKNHWHLVLHPTADNEVSEFMAWLSNAHVRRYRQHYENNGCGHLYQGRFKSFPVGPETFDLLRVFRYVEANPLRAGLVTRAEDWQWSSLRAWLDGPAAVARLVPDEWPIDRPANWIETVNETLGEEHLSQLRTSVERGRPLGAEQWVQETAESLGLTFTLRGRGRPRTNGKGDIQNIPPETPENI